MVNNNLKIDDSAVILANPMNNMTAMSPNTSCPVAIKLLPEVSHLYFSFFSNF